MEAVGEAGSILLNVNGRITFIQSVETENGESSVLSRVTAQKNIELQSSDTIEFADDVTAGVDFTVNAKNIIADKSLQPASTDQPAQQTMERSRNLLLMPQQK